LSIFDQIPLRFPETPLDFDSLTVTDANRHIITAIRHPQRWPFYAVCLVGPEKSGLSTLLLAWAEDMGGIYIDAAEPSLLDDKATQAGTHQVVAIDRADLLEDDSTLLSLLDRVRRSHQHVLIAANSPPGQWKFNSPDLLSRLKSAPILDLPDPDEALMRARLRRAAARSSLMIPPNVEDYLVIRLGLSFNLIEETINRLAGAAGGGRDLTVPVTREVLEAE